MNLLRLVSIRILLSDVGSGAFCIDGLRHWNNINEIGIHVVKRSPITE